MSQPGDYGEYPSYEAMDSEKRHQALYIIGICLLIIICIVVLWVCIMLACWIPGFLKKTLDAWLGSSSMMKRKVASTITRTPLEFTGPNRERNWDIRREASNSVPERPVSSSVPLSGGMI
uniref:Movement protein n=1 Tax=Pea necrotic yellow dwarf virus TaxID=753670 RepID=A0A2R4FYP8_9VIRU|nr:movement protein [Pea necrotic yellow dwarf virus]